MHNLVYLIGRLVEDPKIEKEDEKEVCSITIACTRQFKNENGIYDIDYINIRLENGIATNTCDYCKKGDLLGIKGRLEVNENSYIVVVERVSFLASANKSSGEE